MKGLASYTLFGDNPIYTHGALRNVQIWQSSDFDVDCRFYIGESVPKYVVHALELAGAECIPTYGPEDQTATFWRYDALKMDYDYFLFRDCDSRPYDREFYAIDEWLKSNREVHIIRDHPFHGVPILAGLFGVRSGLASVMANHLPSLPPEDFYQTVNFTISRDRAPQNGYTSNDFYQVDQWWLRLKVYPLCKNKIVAHDEFFGFERKSSKRRLPDRSPENDFIGEGFDCDDNPRFPEHRDRISIWPRRRI